MACFRGLSDIHGWCGGIQMAPSPKQIASCNSSLDWLMSLAIDLPALNDMWRQKCTNGYHLAVLSLYVAFSFHFMTIYLPPPSSYRSANGFGFVSKKLSKMTGNLASYLLNNWWIDRLQIAIQLWQISCKHLFSFPSYNTYLE